MLTTEFEIKAGNSTREILQIVEILADAGVNLMTVSFEKLQGDTYLSVITTDSEAAERSLMKADMAYTTRPVVVAEVDDKPGQWAKMARSLADAGLDIESSYLLSRDGQRMQFVFAVNDPKKGEQVLSKIK